MNHNTGGFFGINEALLSSALAAIVFSVFSVQPLTVVGVTGLISLFNYTIYRQIQQHPDVQYGHIMPVSLLINLQRIRPVFVLIAASLRLGLGLWSKSLSPSPRLFFQFKFTDFANSG